MQQRKVVDTKQLVVVSMLCALAYASVALFRLPVVMFLSYEPKDCILAICGMLYGPIPAVVSAVVVALLEMVTISQTGPIGALMNMLSTVLFILPCSILYQRRRTLKHAVIGLLVGMVLMVAGMLLWNWIVTPWYMGVTRSEIEQLLVPVFLPFNAFKAAMNTTLTILLYKAVVTTLRKARLVPPADAQGNRKISIGLLVIGLVLLAALILVWLVWRGLL